MNRDWQPVISDGELLGTVKNINFVEGFFGDGGGRFFGNGATGFLAKRAKDFSPLRPPPLYSLAMMNRYLLSAVAAMPVDAGVDRLHIDVHQVFPFDR